MYDNFNRVVRFLNIKQESGIEITFCSFLLRMDNNSFVSIGPLSELLRADIA